MRLDYLGRILQPRCKICDQPIFTSCDTEQQSQLVTMLTGRAKDPYTYHMEFPTSSTPETMCFRCKHLNDPKIGKCAKLQSIPRVPEALRIHF